jgi:hypothetical protein
MAASGKVKEIEFRSQNSEVGIKAEDSAVGAIGDY